MVGTTPRTWVLGALAASLLGALALALALMPASAAASATDWTKLRYLNIAHSGGENEAPTNTMYAYKRAMKLGSDMLEIDFHTTSDEEIVIIHDATVDRTTNGTGRVYDKTLKQVQALDAAYNFVPSRDIVSDAPGEEYVFRGVRTGDRKPPPGYKPRDFSIPTLDEVMKAYPDVPINLEIKGAADEDVASYIRNAEILAAYLNKLGRTEGIMVASFNVEALARFHELAPEIDLAPGVGTIANYILGGVPLPEGYVAFQVPLTYDGIQVVTQAFVDKAHGDGHVVHPWTINDEPTMRELLEIGADGIMTAEPMRLEKVLCQEGVERPERPDSVPGKHCSKKASIACEIQPVGIKRANKGRKVRVTLARADDFDGRCAGQLRIKPTGKRAKRIGNFNFGELAPTEGGPDFKQVTLSAGPKLRKATRRGKKVQLMAQTYDAYSQNARIRVR